MCATFQKVDLYGGAITVSLPSNFMDVSTIRDVPSHQEVYVSRAGLTSIIFDLVDRAEPPEHPCTTDEEALEYHYTDLVEAETESTTVLGGGRVAVATLPTAPTYKTLRIQRPDAPPSSRDQPDFTGVLLALIRLEDAKTDLLVTVNVPHVQGEYDAAAVDFHTGAVGPLLEEAGKWQDKILGTLEVCDWGLFAG